MAEKKRTAVSTSKKRGVLLVDDHPIVREGLALLINQEPDLHVCAQASDAAEAIRAIGESCPDMVIVDLALPGIDGWNLLRAIRADTRLAGVPCVAVTAYHSFEIADRAIEEGFVAYFPKPIEATAFVRELEYIVNGD